MSELSTVSAVRINDIDLLETYATSTISDEQLADGIDCLTILNMMY